MRSIKLTNMKVVSNIFTRLPLKPCKKYRQFLPRMQAQIANPSLASIRIILKYHPNFNTDFMQVVTPLHPTKILLINVMELITTVNNGIIIKSMRSRLEDPFHYLTTSANNASHARFPGLLVYLWIQRKGKVNIKKLVNTYRIDRMMQYQQKTKDNAQKLFDKFLNEKNPIVKIVPKDKSNNMKNPIFGWVELHLIVMIAIKLINIIEPIPIYTILN